MELDLVIITFFARAQNLNLSYGLSKHLSHSLVILKFSKISIIAFFYLQGDQKCRKKGLIGDFIGQNL